MHPNIADSSATSPATDLLEGILNASLNGIIAYESVRDKSGALVDFRSVVINRVAQQILYLPNAEPGWQLLAQFPTTARNGSFARYARVTETGKPDRFEVTAQDEDITVWYDVSAVKMGDGFVATFNNVTTAKETTIDLAQRNALLDGILESSPSSIFNLVAVRDDAGQVQDFRFGMMNEKAVHDITRDFERNPIDALLSEVNPDTHQTGQFGAFLSVLATGMPTTQEHLYTKFNLWYHTSITKIGDGVVVTATDITAQKEAALAIEHQVGLNQAMLDGSLNGLLLIEPVYDTAHIVTDFIVLAANPAVERLTGITSDAAIGQLMRVLYPGYEEAGYLELYMNTLKTGKQGRIESYYHDEKGLKGWFEMSSFRQGSTVVVTFASTTEFRKAQQQLTRAADNLQAVIDQSQTGIFVFSPVYDQQGVHTDFRFKTINRMVAALVGQTPEALTGAVASDWFASYRETGLFDKYTHTLRTGEEQRFDINYAVDGFDVWFDVHSMKFGKDVLVTFTDYSDLKRAQLAAEQMARETAQTASLLDSVLNGSINGIMSFEAVRNEAGTITDFRFKTINEASERIVGLSADTMFEKATLLSVFPGNVESGLFDLYVQTTETGKRGRVEVEYKADGLDFWLDVSAQKLADGFVTTFTDTSLIKRAAQAIEQSATELQTVIDTAQTGICVLMPMYDSTGELVDFRFRLSNQFMADYAGMQYTDFAGRAASSIFVNYQENGLFGHYKTFFTSGEFKTRFDFHYNTDGLDAWFDIQIIKIKDELLITFSDFTQLKKLQQQLEASVIDLQRSNKNLEQFAYVASHDLQEPLRKIQQFGDILQTSYAPVLDLSGQDMLKRMQSAAERMRILIRDVLAYSRITTKRENAKAIDLNKLLHEVTGDLEAAITEKNAIIQFDTLPTVAGDAAQLRQLFQNLISNSLKFTKPGHRPELRLRYTVQRGRDTGLPVSENDGVAQFYRFELSDNGIGFDSHQAEKIFQVFQRLHNRNEYQGTGIGLAIVQKVVENHQGYIRAEGQPGEGATFTVLLPV